MLAVGQQCTVQNLDQLYALVTTVLLTTCQNITNTKVLVMSYSTKKIILKDFSHSPQKVQPVTVIRYQDTDLIEGKVKRFQTPVGSRNDFLMFCSV